jgi:hypothetical protein
MLSFYSCLDSHIFLFQAWMQHNFIVDNACVCSSSELGCCGNQTKILVSTQGRALQKNLLNSVQSCSNHPSLTVVGDI